MSVRLGQQSDLRLVNWNVLLAQGAPLPQQRRLAYYCESLSVDFCAALASKSIRRLGTVTSSSGEKSLPQRVAEAVAL